MADRKPILPLMRMHSQKVGFSYGQPSPPHPSSPQPAHTIGAANEAGRLMAVRWERIQAAGDIVVWLDLEIDDYQPTRFQLHLSVGNEPRDSMQAVMRAAGGHYELPLGDGLRYEKSFLVRVFGSKVQSGNMAGGAEIWHPTVIWRPDLA